MDDVFEDEITPKPTAKRSSSFASGEHGYRGGGSSLFDDSMAFFDQSLNKASHTQHYMDVVLDHSEGDHGDEGRIRTNAASSERGKQMKKWLLYVGLLVALVVVSLMVTSSSSKKSTNQGDTNFAPTYNDTTTTMPPVETEPEEVASEGRRDEIHSFILEQEVTSTEDLETANSPQAQALEWLASKDFEEGIGLLQRYALASFFFSVEPLPRDEGRFLQERAPTQEERDNRFQFDNTWLVKADVCQWHGITCNDNQQVTELDLSHTLLKGSVPPELFQAAALPYLTKLQLSHNSLEGTLPSMTVNQKLTELRLEYNHHLEGTLSWITGLGALTLLDLEANQFFGTLPQAGWPADLETLRMASNKLSGPLPPGLQALTQLHYLAMGSNHFAGTIPTQWASLSGLQKLELENNRLHGTIPEFLGTNLPSLLKLSLHVNPLSGEVPSSLGQLTLLEALDLQLTHLNGTMPEQVCALVGASLHTLVADCEKVECPCCTRCY